MDTFVLDWKQKKDIGNNLRLEKFTDMQGHNKMRSKLSIRVFINDKQACNFNCYVLQHFEQLGIQNESDSKWTVQKGESRRSLEWTVARK